MNVERSLRSFRDFARNIGTSNVVSRKTRPVAFPNSIRSAGQSWQILATDAAQTTSDTTAFGFRFGSGNFGEEIVAEAAILSTRRKDSQPLMNAKNPAAKPEPKYDLQSPFFTRLFLIRLRGGL